MIPRREDQDSGIYRIWPEGRIQRSGEVFAAADDVTVERLYARGIAALGQAFYFSVVSVMVCQQVGGSQYVIAYAFQILSVGVKSDWLNTSLSLSLRASSNSSLLLLVWLNLAWCSSIRGLMI